jgi:[acyl-carrier-protein] S-malonyltransferase
MGQDWADRPGAAAVYDQADSAAGFALSRLCFEGPEEQLKLTENTQPAILATSLAVYGEIRHLLPEVACYAGHSLGEYTALVAAGALDLGDAVAIVKERGRLMQVAVPAGAGAMAAVLRLDVEAIRKINAEVATGGRVLDIANLNSPEQIVVSGSADAVEAALPKYEAAGAKRVVELPVSAPFHSALMTPAADNLRPRLNETHFRPTTVPVIANLTVQPYPGDTAQYPMLLHAQIFNPVRWTETIEYFASQGVTHMLEVGPGKVLRMLAPKITRDIKCANVDRLADLESLSEWLDQATTGETE